MAMLNRVAMLVVLSALYAGPAACAQLYKWVDERGAVTYSNQLPVNPGSVKKLAVVEDKVSVYTPDPALLAAVEAERLGRGVSARMAEQDRRYHDERNARQAAAVAALPASGGPCAIWPGDCLSQSESYYYPPAFVTVAPRLHRRLLPHVGPEPPRFGKFPVHHSARSGFDGSKPSRGRGRSSIHPEPKP
jgi:hypothetical protein